MQVEIVGQASGRVSTIKLLPADLQSNLLSWLRKHGFTIASSCEGEGVCRKCCIQEGWLTCELTLEGFLQRQPDGKIYIGYL